MEMRLLCVCGGGAGKTPHYQTSHGEASSCKSWQTQLFPRVQSQVSFGQTPEALRGLIEMSLNLNVL